ncbi:FecR domain-containing protein [Fulvivirgaceae bacterium BMA12]|uniref:FecR domain-containing protein n=1 Tax=Agaribacillus aureus TaxID=3051825 RepID=A0ABT8LBP4_9BACT|nr:FecR domain-containing protein [Fulvivirgaceae bacterium BMA12]
MSNDLFYELAAKKLSNEITQAELREFNQLIKEDRNAELFRWLTKKWEEGESPDPRFNVDSGKALAERKIQQYDAGFTFDHQPQPRPRYLKLSPYMKVAASVLLLLGMAYLLNTFVGIDEKEPAAAVIWKETSTKSGQQSSITLSDGTKVILNAESTLKRPAFFSDSTREVTLSGEAYFEVAKDAKRPFVVHTNDLTTKVLGTTFNIKAYPEENKAIVSLVEGSVEVRMKQDERGDKESFMLVPDQQIILNKSTKISNIVSFDQTAVAGWKDNQFVFDNIPLKDVIAIIERRYGVDIDVENKTILTCMIKSRFNNETLEAILEVISFGTNATYRKKENGTILFTGGGC